MLTYAVKWWPFWISDWHKITEHTRIINIVSNFKPFSMFCTKELWDYPIKLDYLFWHPCYFLDHHWNKFWQVSVVCFHFGAVVSDKNPCTCIIATWWWSLVEQELLALLKHLSSAVFFSERASDCCLIANELFFSYIIVRTRPIHWVGFLLC